MNEDAIRREILRLMESLPQKPDELGLAGKAEHRIATLYLQLSDESAAGDWFVRAADQQEKYQQIIDAQIMLEMAAADVPNHLGVRRALKRVSELIAKARGGN